MSLPLNFSGAPSEEPHRDFRNCCIEFTKTIHSSQDVDTLLEQMERFLDISHHINWHSHPSGHYHKEEAEKAIGKVYREFKRYLLDFDPGAGQALIDAIADIERIAKNSNVT